ncbi:helix-turn-helix domain-containing protein [Clostridium oryzae]|nr:helix-turn-helix domain-containing protein [Clostridium oryzae]
MIFTIFAQMLISLNKFFSDKMMDLSITKIDRDNKIPHILDYINKNLSKKLSLDLLSSIFYINKYHLCHLFKKNTGFTVQEYVIYKRIMKAKELLSQGISAVETCDAVGFGDYSNFYRYFKKVVGKTPKEFFMQ